MANAMVRFLPGYILLTVISELNRALPLLGQLLTQPTGFGFEQSPTQNNGYFALIFYSTHHQIASFSVG
jgi:hypothetical protein